MNDSTHFHIFYTRISLPPPQHFKRLISLLIVINQLWPDEHMKLPYNWVRPLVYQCPLWEAATHWGVSSLTDCLNLRCWDWTWDCMSAQWVFYHWTTASLYLSYLPQPQIWILESKFRPMYFLHRIYIAQYFSNLSNFLPANSFLQKSQKQELDPTFCRQSQENNLSLRKWLNLSLMSFTLFGWCASSWNKFCLINYSWKTQRRPVTMLSYAII